MFAASKSNFNTFALLSYDIESLSRSLVCSEASDWASRPSIVSNSVQAVCNVLWDVPEEVNLTASQQGIRSAPDESRFPVSVGGHWSPDISLQDFSVEEAAVGHWVVSWVSRHESNKNSFTSSVA